MVVSFCRVEEASDDTVSLTVFRDDDGAVKGQVHGPLRMDGRLLIGEVTGPLPIEEAARAAQAVAQKLGINEVEVLDCNGLMYLANK